MKALIGIKINDFLKTADKESGLKLLSSINSNLYDIQKRLMTKRVMVNSLFLLYCLLATGILTVDKIPFLIGNVKEPWFSSLNNIVIILIPAIYTYNHFLLIHSFIYRSQMRLFQNRLIENYFPEILESKFHLFMQPYSPGMNMKNLLQLKGDLHTKEHDKKGNKWLRNKLILIERRSTWFMIPIMLLYNTCLVLSIVKASEQLNDLEFVGHFGVLFAVIIGAFFGTIKLIKLYNGKTKWWRT